MTELAQIFDDTGVPADEPVQVVAEEPQHAEDTAADTTGENAATPAEPPKEQDDSTAKGLQAALLAERRKRQELEARWHQSQQQATKPADAEPDPANFQDNPQEYWRQLARYETRRELSEAVKAAEQQRAMQAQQAQFDDIKGKLDAAIAKGRAKFSDFDAVVNGGLAPFLSDAMREELAESEHSDAVAYWLGKNPAEAQRLSTLSARALAREVIKLEAKVVAPPKPVIPRTLTQERDARGQFAEAGAYDGPTPLDALFKR